LWPLVNPTIVSLPLGFLAAVAGTLIAGRYMENEKRFDAVLLKVQAEITPE
jgi:cation/acetate symporter